MKNLIAFFVLIVILLGFKILNDNNLPTYEFDKLVVISSCEKLLGEEAVNNGNQYYYSFNNLEGNKILKKLNFDEIDGLVYYFDKDYKLDLITNKLDFYYEGIKDLNEIKILYGYDSSFPDYRIVSGKKVNVQIVQNSTNLIVGYPMILCGY